MFLHFRRYLLLVLLLTVPLQGMASVMHALACMPDEAAAASEHAHAGHDHGTPHHHSHDSGGTVSDNTSHQCCHHFSAAPVSLAVKAKSEQSVFQSSVVLLELSFVPEQPQRPPRT